MKPYQVHLFSDEGKIPDVLPAAPIFIYENKRYLNFLVFDCYHLKNNECLVEIAKSTIEKNGIATTDGRIETMRKLQKAMSDIKRVDSLLFFPNDITAFFAALSIFGPKTTFFIDYETSSSVDAVVQYRNVEYYDHDNLKQLSRLLSAKSEKVIVIDGMFEWLGKVSPVDEILKVAQENECIIIANETSTFGLLGREGRGFIDFFNCYDSINIDIGSFSKFLGGYGCYIGAKKYLINKIKENIFGLLTPLPEYMLAVNLTGLEFLNRNMYNKFQELWKNSRYFISRLKQTGFSTVSETPIIVVSFKNNEEAAEFMKKLFHEQIIVAQNKERIRLCLSIEHSKEDLDYCLTKFESVGKELGL